MFPNNKLQVIQLYQSRHALWPRWPRWPCWACPVRPVGPVRPVRPVRTKKRGASAPLYSFSRKGNPNISKALDFYCVEIQILKYECFSFSLFISA